MTTPFESVRAILTNLANDRRRTIGNYTNIVPVPGTSVTPERLISDIGFLSTAQFVYYNAPTSHYVLNTEEDRRDLQKIVITPYGLQTDERNLRNTNRVTPYFANSNYYMSRELNSKGYSSAKNSSLFNRINDRRLGPAYHFVINRLGDVSVGPSLDFEVFTENNPGTDVSIAMETGAIILTSNFTSRNFEIMEEIPFTDAQLFNLSVLITKLKTIYSVLGQYANIIYKYPTNTRVTRKNLLTDVDLITPLVNEQTPFDASTEIFRRPEQTQISTGRGIIRNAISQINTMGALAPLLGNYASIAAAERSSEIAFTQRRQLFVSRIDTAQRDADHDAEQAARAEQSANLENITEVPAINTEPHTYDFETGLWGDGASY